MDLLVFGEDGALTQRVRMSRTDARAVEVPPQSWHSYVCCEPDTVALEVKQGTYSPVSDADFAPWAPAEGSNSCSSFLNWMRSARIGERPDPALA